jgi:DNA-directed RNA polymerase specialized sigma24 family protein
MTGTPPDGSVTIWLDQLQRGNPAAAGPLWEGYLTRLLALARTRLRAAHRAPADEEDVALSAFNSFCAAAARGRFPRLDDRDDLWRVLLAITARKAAGRTRHETRRKRGRVVHASAVPPPTDSAPDLFAGTPGGGPTPELAAAAADAVGRLLGLLGEGELRPMAIWKMEGSTNDVISAKLGVSVSAVERKLALIRTKWTKGAGHE